MYFHLQYMIMLCGFYVEDINKYVAISKKSQMTDQRNDLWLEGYRTVCFISTQYLFFDKNPAPS